MGRGEGIKGNTFKHLQAGTRQLMDMDSWVTQVLLRRPWWQTRCSGLPGLKDK